MFEKIDFIKSGKYSRESDISYTYLKNHLLNLLFDKKAVDFNLFIYKYEAQYGKNAASYFKKTRFSWMNETTGMSHRTIERAIPVIFSSLISSEKKEEILERERVIIVKDILSCFVRKVNDKSKESTICTIESLKGRLLSISSILEEVDERASVFITFRDSQKLEHSKIASAILIDCINRNIERLKEDLIKCCEYFKENFEGQKDIVYFSNFFNFRVDLIKVKLNRFEINDLKCISYTRIQIEKFNYMFSSFIIKESISNIIENQVRNFDGTICDHDVNIFFDKYFKLFVHEQQSTLSASFKGSEGVLNLCFTVTPNSVIRENIFTKSLLIILALCIGLASFGALFKDSNVIIKLFLLIICIRCLASIVALLDDIGLNIKDIRKNKEFIWKINRRR